MKLSPASIAGCLFFAGTAQAQGGTTIVKMCLFYPNESGHARSDPIIITQTCPSGHVHTQYLLRSTKLPPKHKLRRSSTHSCQVQLDTLSRKPVSVLGKYWDIWSGKMNSDSNERNLSKDSNKIILLSFLVTASIHLSSNRWWFWRQNLYPHQ